MGLAVIILFIVLLGYLWTFHFQLSDNLLIRFGISGFWGTVLFIFVAGTLRTNSVFVAFSLAYSIAIGFNIIQVKFFKNINTKPGMHFSTAEILTVIGVFLVYVLIFSRQTIFDTINHFFFAEQIKQAKIPPSIHGFPLLPIKYHYGWDLFVGMIKQYTKMSYAALSSVLTLFLIFSNITIAAKYLKGRKYTGLLFSFTLILIFLGGGFYTLTSSLLFGTYGNGLSLSALFGQSSWLFGVAFLFILLGMLEEINVDNPKNIFIWGLFIFPFLMSVGLLSASAYVLVLLIFLIFTFYLLINFKFSEIYKIAIAATIYFLVFLFISQKMGGMLIKGENFDNPIFIFAPFNIDLKIYTTRVAAYVFTLAPIGLLMLGYMLWKYLKKPVAYFRDTLHDLFLNTVGIVLFCFPLFIWVENAAYWDNFCKFNNYGILASWLIIASGPVRGFLEKKSIHRTTVVILLVLLLSNEFIIRVYNGLTGPNLLKSYNETVRKNKNLLNTVEAHIPSNSQIYLLKKGLLEMYEVDWTISKSKVNLYKYINDNFGDFSLISMELGRSIANFYDYNMFIGRNMEFELWSKLDCLYKGNEDILGLLEGEYIISSITYMPDFVNSWIDKGHVKLVEKSNLDDWIIFRIQ